MLYDLQTVRGYAIAAEDGELGSVHDFYFDDWHWTVRYLVVDTGHWLPGRKVLIAASALRGIDADRGCLRVALSRRQVEDSPGRETDLPVSRQHEIELHDHYRWPYYWGAFPAGVAVAALPPLEAAVAGDTVPGDATLRSAREVSGYSILAEDGKIGHVETLLADDERWLMPYFVIDTRNWLPGRKVLVGTRWISDISWSERRVAVDMRRDAIEESPEYDSAQPLLREYEERLHRHYQRPVYWDR